MAITTIAELKQWEKRWEQKEREAAILGIDIINEDEGRYMMDCPIEHQTCSDENPCTAGDMVDNWDRHLHHIFDHCDLNPCSQCYVIDLEIY